MNKAVAKKDEPQLPTAAVDEVEALAQQDAGRGTSQEASDKFLPLLTILQGLSPQCDQDSPQYMEGARAGVIWLKNFEPPLIDGKDGIIVQPAKLYVEWLEWIPRDRGGGMVGRYLTRPARAKCVDVARNKWIIGDNDLRETRVWVVNLIWSGHPISFAIPCPSTLNTFAKQWNTVIDQQFEASGTKSPAWRHLWKLVTRQRTNAQGKWYVFSFEHVQKVTSREMYEAGKKLCAQVEESIAKGLQITEAVQEDDDDSM
jgi:hypothetical protein